MKEGIEKRIAILKENHQQLTQEVTQLESALEQKKTLVISIRGGIAELDLLLREIKPVVEEITEDIEEEE